MISDHHGGGISYRKIDLPDFPVSWAGGIPAPWAPGYCFGSDDGRIQFIDLEGHGGAGPCLAAPSGEAINGIAFSGDLMVASTRGEVVFRKAPCFGEGPVERAVFPGGAHGVLSTQSGKIVAPMGRRGILVMEPQQASGERVKTLKPADEALNIYRIASLASPVQGEVLACAARRSGFAAYLLDGGEGFGKGLRPTGVDFVDVAALGVDGHPLAVAALGLDCSIHFTRDVLGDTTATSLRFTEFKEKAYRILCTEGHVFLLTSRGLYSFVDLAARFLEGKAIDDDSEMVSRWKLEAVDVSLALDRSLLVVMLETVYRITIDELIADASQRAGNSQILSLSNLGAVMQPPDLGVETWRPLSRLVRKMEQLRPVA